MTKMQALYNFFSSFGIPAYEENSIYMEGFTAGFPYMTYSVAEGAFDQETALNCSLWYRTTSWAEPEKKSSEISKHIGMGGIMLDCDEGHIWIKRGSPFANFIGDDTDGLIKRVSINITAEFFTAD